MITIGIDEVGRGCWAGPLVAGAVAFTSAQPALEGLNDSKKLSRLKRDMLDVLIRPQAAAYGLGWISPEAIDKHGITNAVKGAMEAAVSEVLRELVRQASAAKRRLLTGTAGDISLLGFDDEPIEIVIDGSYNFLKDFVLPSSLAARATVRTLVGADGLVPAVSAASIIAKVARDNFMIDKAHRAYAVFGFDKHVGYGTALHIAALAKYGPCELHRKSYKPVKKFMLH